MTAFRAFRWGWLAASRSKTALVLMWFTYALIAKSVAAPAMLWLIDPLSHSRMANTLLAHFDVNWIGELFEPGGRAVGALAGAAAIAAGLTWLVAILFAGGVLTMLNERWKRFSFSLFLAAAGRHFWRILRLSLFGLICYALVFWLGRLPTFVVKKLFGDGMEAWPLAVAGIVSSILTALLFGWVATVLDYAKVRLVSDDARGAFKALLRSFRFVFRHLGLTMGVWLMNAILLALVGAGYLALSNAVNASTTATILLLVVIQQVFILFRTAQRIAGWSAALIIHSAYNFPPFELDLVPAVPVDAPPELKAGAQAIPEPPDWEGYGI